jgi:hypothetical protein
LQYVAHITKTHEEVRSEVVNWLRENGELLWNFVEVENEADWEAGWEADWEAWCDQMATDETWGDELTLRAAVVVYGHNITVFHADGKELVIIAPHGVEHENKQYNLFLAHYPENHYDSTEKINNSIEKKYKHLQKRFESRISHGISQIVPNYPLPFEKLH